VVADISPLGFTDDVDFCRLITEEAGVTAVPMSAFYQDPDIPRHFVRFCCAKQNHVLDAAVDRLTTYFQGSPSQFGDNSSG
jgi:aspartate/methionine/tyrosine aminotransferase